MTPAQLNQPRQALYFDDLQPVRARRTDPQTSHDAASRAERFAASHAGRILAALKEHGPGTPAALSGHTGLTVVQIDRRLPELRVIGLAWPTGEILGGYRVWKCAAATLARG